VVLPDGLDAEVVEHAAVGEVDLADELVPVALRIGAARERRRLLFCLDDAEGARHAGGRRDGLRERPLPERPVPGRRAADQALARVEDPLVAEAHVAGQEHESRRVGKVIEPSGRRALRIGGRERLALRTRREPLVRLQAGEGGARAGVSRSEPAHGPRHTLLEALDRLAGLARRAPHEGGELCRHDAAARHRGERVDPGEDPELVHAAQRAEVEERRAVASPRHAEGQALSRSLMREELRDPVLGGVLGHAAGA
jgi:hypothetical protein